MRPVTTSVDIDRDATEVFAFVSEVANNPRWQRGMQSARWTSSPPLRNSVFKPFYQASSRSQLYYSSGLGSIALWLTW